MNLTEWVVRSSQELQGIYLPLLQVQASKVNIVPIYLASLMTEENKSSLLTYPPTTARLG